MNIVLFDGICNLCSTTVSFLLKHDTGNHLHFAAQQTESGKTMMQLHQIENNHQSVMLIKGDTVFYKTDAIIEIAKLMAGWPAIFKYLSILPKGTRDALYDLFSRNRYRIFGKKTTCYIPAQAVKDKFL